ncbi:MAG: sodium:calcium antiporter, partial [Rhodothermia bacterium]
MTEWLISGWLPALGFFAAGIVLLTAGAEALVGASQTIAVRSGLSPLVVGLTVVAFSTSTPELVASLVAASQGSFNLAMGNVVGSNIANIGLVLGIAALVRPLVVHRRVAYVDTPLALALTLILSFFLLGGEVRQWEAAILFAGIILYA